jgi:parallel beta-helix repeat protein
MAVSMHIATLGTARAAATANSPRNSAGDVRSSWAISSAADCQESTITTVAEADSWIDEGSALTNKGSDAILNVEYNPPDNSLRALVRFPLPSGAPPGCVVESAKLRLFAPEESVGSTVQAVRLGSAWREDSVTWSNQPYPLGAPATAWSTEGYMQWNVTSQVEAMLGANHGFLIRDAAEGTEGVGGDHGFDSREKGENPPRLVVHFAAPQSGEPPEPDPPTPAAVSCGQVLTRSTRVVNDVWECPGDGLVIGAPGIIVDLDGHTIDGIGLGTGIRNDGYASVTVENGTVQGFDYGIQLRWETALNVLERLTVEHNELAGVQLFDTGAGGGNTVSANTIANNGDGIALVSGTTNTAVVKNTVTISGGWGLVVRDSDANRLENNSVTGGGDLGIGLQRASGNTLLGNTVSGNSDGGIELREGSNGNLVEANVTRESGDTGILVLESDRNELISNTASLMSDSGITLHNANDGVALGNDVRFNTGGLQLDGSSRNLIQSNDGSITSGIGIELGGGSLENHVVGNAVNANGAQGIYVADDATDGLGNLIERNTANGNASDGIAVAKGGHTLTANIAMENGSWGINAGLGSIDGGGNVAADNFKPDQCIGIFCHADLTPPSTSIVNGPPDPTNATTASFSFTGTDETTPEPALAYECRLDSQAEGDFTACSSPQTYSELASGFHTFEVRAIDQSENADPTPASYTWTISPSNPCTITGTASSDMLTGTSGPDMICGLGGNDVIDGAGGNDTLIGGVGNDRLIGGPGNDALTGGRGGDTVDYRSAPAGVTVNLSTGAASGHGNDSLSGVEHVLGSAFADTITGSGGANTLSGGHGNDTIHGMGGNDTVNGQSGDDTLTGGDGNDTLTGGAGIDSLDAGAGTDTCTGGETLAGCED